MVTSALCAAGCDHPAGARKTAICARAQYNIVELRQKLDDVIEIALAAAGFGPELNRFAQALQAGDDFRRGEGVHRKLDRPTTFVGQRQAAQPPFTHRLRGLHHLGLVAWQLADFD